MDPKPQLIGGKTRGDILHNHLEKIMMQLRNQEKRRNKMRRKQEKLQNRKEKSKLKRIKQL